MKDIKSLLNKIEIEKKTIEKIGTFLKTKRGQKFVKYIHTKPIPVLCDMCDAPKFMLLYKDNVKNRNIILAAIKKYDIPIPKYTPIKIGFSKGKKFPVRLNKKEIVELTARYTPKKMGFAALMHAYEEYAMQKFTFIHPAPTERELKEDLFPEELKAGYNNMLYIHREYVRNLLCKKYAKRMPKESFFRVFTVLSVTEDPATGRKHKPVISEVEAHNCYAFKHLSKSTPRKELHEILVRSASTAYRADKQAIKMKLYDKYGNLIDVCKCKL